MNGHRRKIFIAYTHYGNPTRRGPSIVGQRIITNLVTSQHLVNASFGINKLQTYLPFVDYFADVDCMDAKLAVQLMSLFSYSSRYKN